MRYRVAVGQGAAATFLTGGDYRCLRCVTPRLLRLMKSQASLPCETSAIGKIAFGEEFGRIKVEEAVEQQTLERCISEATNVGVSNGTKLYVGYVESNLNDFRIVSRLLAHPSIELRKALEGGVLSNADPCLLRELDMVLAHVELRDMNGFQLGQKLREKMPDLLFVLTGFDQEFDKLAHEASFEFLALPDVSPEALWRLVENHRS